MQEDMLSYFLNNIKQYDAGTTKSRITNCRKVCKFEGDLDEHFNHDKCGQLLQRLNYTTEDQRNKRPKRHNIPINGDIRNGSATLKQAVTLYIEFRKWKLNDNTIVAAVNTKINHTISSIAKSTKVSNWIDWEQPNEEDIYALAQVTCKYVRFLSPTIIQAIIEDNSNQYEIWKSALSAKGINPELYIWEQTPCCFPGIRRHAGSKEIAAFRKHSELESIENAFCLDDNDYPKQLWSFVFRGKQFSKFGPAGYSLAHLIDHKEYGNRMSNELKFTASQYEHPFFGLYTCPTNTVYIPNALLKPTDFNSQIRNLLLRKAFSLYEPYCNLLPYKIKPVPVSNSKWEIENFNWSKCVGTTENIDLFLQWRNKKLKGLFAD